MRSLLVVMCCALAACAPAVIEEPEQVGVARQAYAVTPDFTGAPGDDWGAALAPCPGGGYVAGAPATGRTRLDPVSSVPTPALADAGGLGREVACLSENGVRRVLAGSDAGLFVAEPDGGWRPLLTGPVVALARPRSSTLPLLVGGGDQLRQVDQLTLNVTSFNFAGPAGFGDALAWDEPESPGIPRVAVSSPRGGQLQVFAWPIQASSVPLVTLTRQGPLSPIVFGDVHPADGVELIARTESSTVTIFSRTGTELMVLRSTNPGSTTFGASLAVNPLSKVAPLEELWVGEPGANKVYRFIGDAGTSTPVPANANLRAFGASIVIHERTQLTTEVTLSVGDPEYVGTGGVTGAVFTEAVPVNSVILGEPRECTVGVQCRNSNCIPGDCIGGVFCAGPVLQECPVGTVCNFASGSCEAPAIDAGVLDAGINPSRDAGTVPGRDAGLVTDEDAGVADAGIDAGVADGGAVDAGVADAGRIDAGKPLIDAGVVEPEHDAGVVDGGAVDAGEADAGSIDAGKPLTDAGVETPAKDAGVGADEVVVFRSCGCSGGAAVPLGLLGLGLLRRRRR